MQTDALPVALVQDLLAVTRMLYRAWRASAEPADRLEELTFIGRKLTTALELARANPGTVGHRAAWVHAEEATLRLGRVLAAETKVSELVATARLELVGEPTATPANSERESKRLARRERS